MSTDPTPEVPAQPIQEEVPFLKKFATTFKKVVTNEEFQKTVIVAVVQVTTAVVATAVITVIGNGIQKGVNAAYDSWHSDDQPEGPIQTIDLSEPPQTL